MEFSKANLTNGNKSGVNNNKRKQKKKPNLGEGNNSTLWKEIS